MMQEAGFEQSFGFSPLVTASAPGRVNLIGEHTDYNGGAVLPAALDCRVQVAIGRHTEPVIKIKSTRFDTLIERPVGDARRGDWTDYAMGALNKAAELNWLTGGVCLYIDSNVPDGAGVSSSAALITAIFRAVTANLQSAPTGVEIAKYARAVENDYIGMPCGIMDQMAVGLAEPGTALALDTADMVYEIINIPEAWHFAVIHSGVRRELADGRYKARFEECQQAAELLQAPQLCRLTPEQSAAMLDLPENLKRRARHVWSEHQRTVEASKAMQAGNIATFARLMNESHTSYSQDFEASTGEIDALVSDAVDCGAHAARLTGGGFGGCIVVLIDREGAEAWCETFLKRHPKAWLV